MISIIQLPTATINVVMKQFGEMGQSIYEWTKKNLWKTDFTKLA